MASMRSDIIAYGSSDAYRSVLTVTTSGLEGREGSLRSVMDIRADEDTCMTVLTLSNRALELSFMCYSDLERSTLLFCDFFNTQFAASDIWKMLARGTDEQINISHLTDAYQYFCKHVYWNDVLDKPDWVEHHQILLQDIYDKIAAAAASGGSSFDKYFAIDEDGDIYVKDRTRGFYSYKFVSAGGKSAIQGEGGGGLIDNIWTAASFGREFSENGNDVFNAHAVNQLYLSIEDLKQKQDQAGKIKNVYNVMGLGGTYSETDNESTFNAHAINKIYADQQLLKGSLSDYLLKADWEKHPAYEITQANINLWNKISGLFDTDAEGDVYVKNSKGFYSDSFISAAGKNAATGGSGGMVENVYDYTDFGRTFDPNGLDTFNAYAIDQLHSGIAAQDAIIRGISGQLVTVTESLANYLLKETWEASAASKITAEQVTAWEAVSKLFKVDVDGDVYVADAKGFYSDSFISAAGKNSAAGQAGGTTVEWEQLYTDTTGVQIANLTIYGQPTIPIYVPKAAEITPVTPTTALADLTTDVTLDDPQTDDVLYFDGYKWTNIQIATLINGKKDEETQDNPYYDDAVVVTLSNGTVERVPLENGEIRSYWSDWYANSSRVVKIEIGKNCTRVSSRAFYGMANVREIWCYGETAPRIPTEGNSNNAFTNFQSYNGTLHYPANGEEYYQWYWVEDAWGAPGLGDTYGWNVIQDAVTPAASGGGSGDGSSVEVINNLTSTSTTAALSANQGRVLNDKINNLSLSDFASIRSLSNGDILIYRSGVWTNVPISNYMGGGSDSGESSGPINLGDLLDVSAGSPSNGDVLYWNGSRWINYPSSNFGSGSSSGSGSGSSSYTLPLAANGTRGGIQVGYASSGKNIALKLSNEKAYVTLPDTYIGTTQVQYSSLAQALTGITDLTMSGTLRIGSALLSYNDGVLTLTGPNGSVCSFYATGNVSAGQ